MGRAVCWSVRSALRAVVGSLVALAAACGGSAPGGPPAAVAIRAPAAETSDGTDALAAVCAQVRAESGAFAAAHLAECFPAGRGAWRFRAQLEHAEIHSCASGEDGPTLPVERGTWSMVYVTPDGRQIAPAEAESISLPEGETCETFALPSVGPIFDWDGDGVAEVVVTWEIGQWEAPSEWHRTILTFRDGAVREYAPAHGVRFEDVRDVDGDGRPDLIRPRHCLSLPTGGEDTDDEGCLDWPARSEADGTFHDDGPAVFASVLRQCPAPGRLVTATASRIDAAATGRAISCARLRGAPLADVQRRILAELPRNATFVTEGEPAAYLLQLAADVAPLASLPTAPAPEPAPPAAAARAWWCMCHVEHVENGGDRLVTSCRATEAECTRLRDTARAARAPFTGAADDACLPVGAPHPADLLGERDEWQPSARAGAWQLPGICALHWREPPAPH